MSDSVPDAKAGRDRVLLTVLAVVLAVLVAAVIITRVGSDDTAPGAGPAPSAANRPGSSSVVPDGKKWGPLGDLSRREATDGRALGRIDAPVVMVVFSDFRCGFCGEYERQIQPELVKKYVDPGVLRIEWRDDVQYGEQSGLAARAGWAATAQGRFWPFVEAVYANMPVTGHPDLTIDTLVGHAETAGVKDLKRFREEALSDEYDQDVKDDMKPVHKFGILGTPAFVIDGVPMIGVRPLSVFEGLIEDAEAGR